ncbi:peptidoglycan-binding domain-containing protein [Streptomyces sp. NPDC046831]|uniref:peptidoglycan-binding domain-containing protein n=1 Tax=Streptomyces sp. NPDC046831 TaxID=3154805 RepID=UPI0033EB691C
MAETVTHLDDAPETSPAPPPPHGRHGRRTALVASAVVLVAAVAVIGALGLGGGGDEGPSAPPRSGSVVAVKRGNLAERTAVDGRLGYGTEIPLPVKATGTVTWLPEQGETVGRGGTLLRVDDRPVVLLYGMLPMYRDIGLTPRAPDQEAAGDPQDQQGQGRNGPKNGAGPPAGTPASAAPDGAGSAGGAGNGSGDGTGATAGAPRELTGMDVMQFETNLAALGYTGFTVDERFTAATARAVMRWQKDLGLPPTGTVGVGDVIYSSGRVRIGHAGVRPGAEAGENVLTFTGTSRKVVVDASAADAAWAVRGTDVRVELPDGRTALGRVASVGRQAAAAEGGGEDGGSQGANATVPVTVTVEDQASLGRLESGPVTVEYVGREVKDVLTVPVSALVALAEGGYGLETEDGRFVAVRTGLFADGSVEVSGSAVRAGMKVRIPE